MAWRRAEGPTGIRYAGRGAGCRGVMNRQHRPRCQARRVSWGVVPTAPASLAEAGCGGVALAPAAITGATHHDTPPPMATVSTTFPYSPLPRGPLPRGGECRAQLPASTRPRSGGVEGWADAPAIMPRRPTTRLRSVLMTGYRWPTTPPPALAITTGSGTCDEGRSPTSTCQRWRTGTACIVDRAHVPPAHLARQRARRGGTASSRCIPPPAAQLVVRMQTAGCRPPCHRDAYRLCQGGHSDGPTQPPPG